MKKQKLRPDSKGRISLGKLAKNVSGFLVSTNEKHQIILTPQVEISAHEKWLFDNKVAMSKVAKGLSDAKAGNISSKGSFSKYLDDEPTKKSKK